MVIVNRHREPRQLDRPRKALGVDQRVRSEALTHGDLGAIDVIGRKARIGGAARRREDLAPVIDDVGALLVALADTPDIADVVAQASPA